MSTKDVIKKSVLESPMYNQAISGGTILSIIIDLLFALLLGVIIYEIYKHYYKGVVYSRNYAVSLIAMTVLTCMVTLAISTNVIISLGMVGALSIVRYRTAVKEPLDLVYMFWAITSGITAGASMYLLAAIAFVIMFLLIYFFNKKEDGRETYIMVIHFSEDATGDEIIKILEGLKYQIRSRVMHGDTIEMVVQVAIRKDNISFAEKIRELPKVKDVSVIEFDDEYHG